MTNGPMAKETPMSNDRLLIIEDELPMRTALKDCLESEGYRVLTAADGESGLKRALEEKPDLDGAKEGLQVVASSTTTASR